MFQAEALPTRWFYRIACRSWCHGQLKPWVYAHPAIQLDLTATVLAAAGVVAGADLTLDGFKLLPFLNDVTGLVLISEA
jgi:hypothetical protein